MSMIEQERNFIIKPRDSNYATLPITEGFNWDGIFNYIPQSQVELVVFRSTQRSDADVNLLTYYDNEAHKEAITNSPGLIYYFQGDVTIDRKSLSFCLWKSQDELRKASQEPKHRAAVNIAETMYEDFQLERYTVRKSGKQDNARVVFEAK